MPLSSSQPPSSIRDGSEGTAAGLGLLVGFGGRGGGFEEEVVGSSGADNVSSLGATNDVLGGGGFGFGGGGGGGGGLGGGTVVIFHARSILGTRYMTIDYELVFLQSSSEALAFLP